MFNIATAPAKQSVGDTISVLSSRLASASLLEDRRAAILGLRSFAKDFPATVASGALRSLIGSLSKDGEDADTVKSVLETLLMLFSPNQDSPEASEEIALWLADEFTQRQENISLLLGLLEASEFYIRLYALQLLAAILSARTDRTEECVFTATVGVSRLVAVLDDHRDAIRNEAVSLLISLTPTSLDIQKLVAFEGAFEKLFAIIASEGSLAEGGRTVEDCLILLANLIRQNASNQLLFCESGCVKQLAYLLENAFPKHDDPLGQPEQLSPWAQAQHDRNLYAFLAVMRLFLVPGSSGLAQNQTIFWKHAIPSKALHLAFAPTMPIQCRVEALGICADIIRKNSILQESFARLQVISRPPDSPDTPLQLFIIDGLLDMILGPSYVSEFDLRFAACECLKSYLYGHSDVQLHFLATAIDGYQSGQDDPSNVLCVLLQPSADVMVSDPYRFWFAAVIMFYLVFSNPDSKARAMAIREGDAANGEEVVTGIQILTSHLVAGIQRGDDSRILIAYLMLLIGWVFEDMDAVNDFLGEGSNVQALATAIKQPKAELVSGLCAMLLGLVYEFSTKDSPVSRATIHSVIDSVTTRDVFVNRLSQLRTHPLLRDFEVTPQVSGGNKVPDIFFDSKFVEFFKDNYSTTLRAVDRDPGFETSFVANGVQRGISRELVDSLRAQLEDKTRQLDEVHAATRAGASLLEQEKLAAQRKEQDMEGLRGSIKRLSEKREEDLQKHKSDMTRLEDSYRLQLETCQRQALAEVHAAQRRIEAERTNFDAATRQAEQRQRDAVEAAQKAAQQELDRVQRRTDAEAADFKATISRLEVDLMKATKARTADVQAVRDEFEGKLKAEQERARQAEGRAAEVKARADEATRKLAETQKKLEKAEAELAAATEHQKTAQGEMDDLLMVISDLEESIAKYKKRLVASGQALSDGEDDDDEEAEEDDDDEDDEEEEEDEDDEEDEDEDEEPAKEDAKTSTTKK